MLVTKGGMTMERKRVPLNASSPIVLSESGKLTDSKAHESAPFPIDVTVLGISIDVSEVQPVNMFAGMLVSRSGKVAEDSFPQPLKTPVPMKVTEAGKSAFSKAVLAKAELPM